MELMAAAVGGFVLAQLAFPLVIHWLVLVYAQFALEPPETRRAQTLIPIFLLHSGPWALALMIFACIKLLASPEGEWRPWLVGGFVVGCGILLVMIAMGLKKIRRADPQSPTP